MSEYRRFASYLYQYEQDEKGKNVGFSRIELRDGRRRVQIQVRGAERLSGSMEVCGFVRDGRLCVGIPFGKMQIQNGCGVLTAEMTAEEAGEKEMESWAGLFLIPAQTGRRGIATVWDEGGFALSRLVRSRREWQELQAAYLHAEPESETEPEPETDPEPESPAEDAAEEEKAAEEKREEAPPEKKDSEGLFPAFDWNRLSRLYPKVRPFKGETRRQCLRIRPGDLGRLPRSEWVLGNNSFLLHGYYQYRYLLLIRETEEPDPEMGAAEAAVLEANPSYYIGVPGNSGRNERFLAGLFGFERFYPAEETKNSPSFGFWCREIELEEKNDSR